MPKYYIVPRLVVAESDDSLSIQVWSPDIERISSTDEELGKHRREAVYSLRTEAEFKPERFRSAKGRTTNNEYVILWPEEIH